MDKYKMLKVSTSRNFLLDMDNYRMLKVSTSRFFYEIWATIKSGERFQKP